jgi:hypothetical protein
MSRILLIIRPKRGNKIDCIYVKLFHNTAARQSRREEEGEVK